MMESMISSDMTSTDMHIMRIPSEDDPMMMDAGSSERPVNLFATDQKINDQEKNLSDLVAEAEKSNSLIAYSSYDKDDQMQKMSNTSSGISSGVDPSQQDIYAQLAQKEKDLVLAAELGKALLGKNEDLVRQNEKLQDDFSQRLEVRTMLNYILKLKITLFIYRLCIDMMNSFLTKLLGSDNIILMNIQEHPLQVNNLLLMT